MRAHYERALAWLVPHFGRTPAIAVTYPAGLGTAPVFHKGLADPPATVATIPVRTSTGVHAYPRLDAHNVTWLVAGRFAVEFHSWSPTFDDPSRAAFGRLALIQGHEVRTVAYQGWTSLTNGELLKAARDSGFAVLSTADRSMRYQQSLELGDLANIVLSSNEAATVGAYAAAITRAIDSARPGAFTDIDLSEGTGA